MEDIELKEKEKKVTDSNENKENKKEEKIKDNEEKEKEKKKENEEKENNEEKDKGKGNREKEKNNENQEKENDDKDNEEKDKGKENDEEENEEKDHNEEENDEVENDEEEEDEEEQNMINLKFRLSKQYFINKKNYFDSLKLKSEKIKIKLKKTNEMRLNSLKLPIYYENGYNFETEIQQMGMLNEFYLKAKQGIEKKNIDIRNNGIYIYKYFNQNQRISNYNIFLYCIKNEKVEDEYLSNINNFDEISHSKYENLFDTNENSEEIKKNIKVLSEKEKYHKKNNSFKIKKSKSDKNATNQISNSAEYNKEKLSGLKNRAISLESLVNFNLRKLKIITLPDLIFNITDYKSRLFLYREIDGAYLNSSITDIDYNNLKFIIPFNVEKIYHVKIDQKTLSIENNKFIILKNSILLLEVKTHFPREQKEKSKKEILNNVIKDLFEKVKYFMRVYKDILQDIKIENIQLFLLYDQNKLKKYKNTINDYIDNNKEIITSYLTDYNIFFNILYIFPSIGKISLNLINEELKYLKKNAKKNENLKKKIEKIKNDFKTKEEEIEKIKNDFKTKEEENKLNFKEKKEEIEQLKKDFNKKDKEKKEEIEQLKKDFNKKDKEKEEEIEQLKKDFNKKDKEKEEEIQQLKNEYIKKDREFKKLKQDSDREIYNLKDENKQLQLKIQEVLKKLVDIEIKMEQKKEIDINKKDDNNNNFNNNDNNIKEKKNNNNNYINVNNKDNSNKNNNIINNKDNNNIDNNNKINNKDNNNNDNNNIVNNNKINIRGNENNKVNNNTANNKDNIKDNNNNYNKDKKDKVNIKYNNNELNTIQEKVNLFENKGKIKHDNNNQANKKNEAIDINEKIEEVLKKINNNSMLNEEEQTILKLFYLFNRNKNLLNSIKLNHKKNNDICQKFHKYLENLNQTQILSLTNKYGFVLCDECPKPQKKALSLRNYKNN